MEIAWDRAVPGGNAVKDFSLRKGVLLKAAARLHVRLWSRAAQSGTASLTLLEVAHFEHARHKYRMFWSKRGRPTHSPDALARECGFRGKLAKSRGMARKFACLFAFLRSSFGDQRNFLAGASDSRAERHCRSQFAVDFRCSAGG